MQGAKFFLLGRPLITLEDIPVEGFVSDKALALLCYLALEEGSHSRDTLAGLLWGEMLEDRAKANLRMALYNLQHILPECLLVSRTTAGLNPQSSQWVDVKIFLSTIKAGPADFSALRAAVNLYRGDFLEGLFVEDAPEFEAWLLNYREHLKLAALQAIEKLANHYFTHREWDDGIEFSRRILAIEPWHEDSHRQLMAALARKGEYTAALAQYETCRRIIDKEIGVEPAPETVSLYQRISQIRQQPNRHNLPAQPTPFIGREDELRELKQLLANPECRLLTLVGTGGIGKSRLALRAAQDQVGSFLDGLYWVPLAGVGSAELIPSAAVSALSLELHGLIELRTQLLDYLRDREILLVLDNFEHLLGGSKLLADILEQASEVKILITSRERLNLHSEWVHTVLGLSYPKSGTSLGIENYSAVTLYTQAARRMKGSFVLDEAERPCVAHICQMVEGMPLAVELAASWIRALNCEDIASEIERSIGILASQTRDLPERHRSIRAVFDHSWKLLTENEQSIMRRLSVFRGGFTRQAAEQVVGASLVDLSSLVDKSLLQTGPHLVERLRYDLHELIRQYAGELLQASGELNDVQDRHLVYFAEYTKSADRVAHTEEFALWLARLEAEIDNLRAALAWGLITPQAHEAGLRLVGDLVWYWYFANHWREGRAWAERMLTVMGSEDFPVPKAKVLLTAGGMALALNDYPFAERYLEESENIFRKANDQRGLAFTLCILGMTQLYQGNFASAQRLEDESVALFQTIQEKPGYLFAIANLGDVLLYQGEYEQAKAIYSISLDLSQELGNPAGLAYALLNLGEIERYQGNVQLAEAHLEQSVKLAAEIGMQRFSALAFHNLGRVAQDQGQKVQAHSHFVKSLQLFRELGDQMGMIACLERLASQAILQRQLERAAHLFAIAAAAREATSIPVPLSDQATVSEGIASVRQILGSERFDLLWDEGSAMTLEKAIPYALEENE